MHLYCGRSFLHPIQYVDILQWNFHVPGIVSRLAKYVHVKNRSVQTAGHQRRQDTQVHDKRLLRHLYPINHHKQFPRNLCEISLLFPLRSSFLQLVSKHLNGEQNLVMYNSVFRRQRKCENTLLRNCVPKGPEIGLLISAF